MPTHSTRAARSSLAITLLLFLVSAAPAQMGSVEGTITGLEKAWNQAELHHDVSAVSAFLADGFVRVDDRGRLVSRAQYLAAIADRAYVSEQIFNEDLKIYVYGNTAVAVSTFRVKGRDKGKTFLHRGRFIDTWVQIDSRWLCVANQETLIQ